MREKSYLEAIKEAVWQGMEAEKYMFVLGEGSDPALGSFHRSSEMFKQFGEDRIYDTPLSEVAMQGISIGAAMNGVKSIMVWFRLDFMLMAFDQIINHASKLKYIYDLDCPIVMKTTIGRGWGQGPNHSQSFHSVFSHFPGLKVVLPSNPYDAKGLMTAAIKDKNPIIFIEHKSLFNEVCKVPDEIYEIPIGKGEIKKNGKDVTIVAFSTMVLESLIAAKELESQDIDAEVIDLRSSYPLDQDLIIKSVNKTGRLVIADIDWLFCGIGAEISAIIIENCFSFLKSPIKRVGLPHVSHPTSFALEELLYPTHKDIINAVKEIL